MDRETLTNQGSLQAVQEAVAGFGPVTVTLGKKAYFPASEHRPSDVAYLEVESDDLRRLYHRLCQRVPHWPSDYDRYTPHVTVAYLKPGKGKEWTGDGRHPLEGRSFTVDRISYSNANHGQVDIPLHAELSTVAGEGSEEDLPAIHVILHEEPAEEGDVAKFATSPSHEADPEDARHLAAMYAHLWNLLEEHGDDIPEEELHAASEELSGSGWTLFKEAGQPWRAVSLGGLDGYELGGAERAPRGGVTLLRTDPRTGARTPFFYRGGMWIPKSEIDQLTPEQHAALEQMRQASQNKLVGGGHLDPAALRQRLEAHAGEALESHEKTALKRSFNALHGHHKELVLHRIHQLAGQAEHALNNISDEHPNAEGLKRYWRAQLAKYHHMLGLAEKKGVTGQVPEHILKAAAQAQTQAQPTPHEQTHEQLAPDGSSGESGGLPPEQPVGVGSKKAPGTEPAGAGSGAPEGGHPGELPASAGGGRDELRGHAPGRGDESTHGAGAGHAPATGGGEPAADAAAVGGGGGAGGHGSGSGEDTAPSEVESAPSEVESVLSQPPTPEAPTDLSTGNFRYEGTDFVPHGLKAKAAANIEALRLLKGLQAEGRDTITPAEAEVLSKFTGWGQFPGIFNEYDHRSGQDYYEWLEEHKKWNKEREAVKGLLSPEEWKDAARSILNAHYTNPDIVKAHWQMAGKLGYTGGHFLETSAGIGYYLGLMPPELAGKTRGSAVEKDAATGQMLKLLYPKSNVQVSGFEDFKMPDGFYDLIASNVPFGDFGVHDKRYNKHNAKIHDYFLLKSLDLAKPGGLVMHITSKGTMDKGDASIRKALADKGELVGAIRFPGGAHKDNAGTEVVTDLLILRKKDPNLPPVDPNETPEEAQPKQEGFSGITTDKLGRLYHWKDGQRIGTPDWTGTTTVPDPAGGEPIPVNQYFVDHPEHVLGVIDRTGSMYRGDSANVSPLGPEEHQKRLQAFIDHLPEGVLRYHKAPAERFTPEVLPAPGEVKEKGYTVKDGKAYVRSGGKLVKQDLSAKDLMRLQGHLDIRDVVRALFKAERAGADTTELRQKLNTVYDEFVKKHGYLNDRANRSLFRADPDAPVLLALEDYDPKAKKAAKRDIFSKLTVRPDKTVTHVGSSEEALAVSLHESGGIDLAHMARLTGLDEETIGHQLSSKGLAYHDPDEGWKAADQYLSGNVRRKLLMARAAAKADPKYQANVDALQKVQPADIDYTEIKPKLGAPWVPPTDIDRFASSLLGRDEEGNFEIAYNPRTGEWHADYTRDGKWLANGRLADQRGTRRVRFMDLFEAALNNKTVTVRDPQEEGKSIVNPKETADANARIQQIRDEFKKWIWEDDARRQRLHRYYNDNFNNIRHIQYNGQHLTFPGMNPAIELRDHQKNMVWQIITTGKGMMAHEVGVGKTYAMVAAAMELRRMGLAKKPCIACLKTNIEAITADAQRLYPGARILSTADMFTADKRKETISRIASGDYDLILMTHDHLDMLPMSPETEKKFVEEQLDELKGAVLEAQKGMAKIKGKSQGGDRVVKDLQKAQEKLEKRLKELLDSKKDDAIHFEDSGLDHLFVDESDSYKGAPIYTRQRQIKGIPTGASQRASNMLMRTQWLMQHNGGRGVVFASGTPVANSMAEMYNLQRYLQPDELKERGVYPFDAWAATFGEIETKPEFTVTGEYRPVSRFRNFANIPELMQISRQMMDVQRVEDMKNPDGSPAIARPIKIEHAVESPNSPAMKKLLKSLQSRAKVVRAAKPGTIKDNMLVICTDGRKGAVDMRLLDPDAPDDPLSKTNQCVAKVLEIAKARPGVTQLIFSDVGVNPIKPSEGQAVNLNEEGEADIEDVTDEGSAGAGVKKFHLYGDIIDKLVRGGIPREKIANFAELSGNKKEEAMADMRSGKILVGIGGTKKLGTGVNVQNKLAALHHLDVPWKPADLEQRDGRGHRQGNKNDPTKDDDKQELHVYRYVAKGSLDQTFWQIIANKAGFIKQVMKPASADVPREAREVDTEELSPEQFMALASGDPRVMEKVNLDEEVKQLHAARERHDRDQERLQHSIASGERAIPVAERQIEGMKRDEQVLVANPDPLLVIDGQSYAGKTDEEKQAAEEATKKKAEQIDERKIYPQQVGTFRGMPLMRDERKIYLQGETEEYPTGWGLGSITAVARMQGRRVKDAEAELANRRAELDKLKKEVGKPFAKADELARKVARQAELHTELSKSKEQEQRERLEPIAKEIAGRYLEDKNGKAAEAAYKKIVKEQALDDDEAKVLKDIFNDFVQRGSVDPEQAEESKTSEPEAESQPAPASAHSPQPTDVEQGVALFNRLRDTPDLSLDDMRNEFHAMRKLPKAALQEVARQAGFDFSGSKEQIATKLLQVLERLKVSQVKRDIIRREAGMPPQELSLTSDDIWELLDLEARR